MCIVILFSVIDILILDQRSHRVIDDSSRHNGAITENSKIVVIIADVLNNYSLCLVHKSNVHK